MNRSIALLLFVAALFVGYVLWSQIQRAREDAALESAAMAVCAKTPTDGTAARPAAEQGGTTPSDEVKCRNAIRRHHDACRTIATTVVSTGPKSAKAFVSPDAYADCVTRGPAVIKEERAAARRAEEQRKADALR